jgi:hypothetical protein
VRVTPDGLTAHYLVVDQEQLFNKGSNCPAVRVEAMDQSYTSLDRNRRAFTSYMGWTWRFLGESAENVQAGQERMAASLSSMYKTVIVRVWGNGEASRRDLVTFGLRIAQSRMGRTAIFDTTLSEMKVNQDTQNFVQVEYTISWNLSIGQSIFAGVPGLAVDGTIAGLFGGPAGPLGPGQTDFTTSIAQSPNIGPIPSNNGDVTITQSALTANPPFPNGSGANGRGSGTLGTDITLLLTQVLEGFDESPFAVP